MGTAWAQVASMVGPESTKIKILDVYETVNLNIQDGKLKEASELANTHLATQPRDPQMRFLKGVIQHSQGQIQDATATFTLLTQDYPELPEPYNNLGVLWSAQNQPEKAREALEMALRLYPDYATAHENLGLIYLMLARQSYEKARQLVPAYSVTPLGLKIDQLTLMLSQPPNKTSNPKTSNLSSKPGQNRP